MKKILIINQSYIPGYKAGGPIQTIKKIVDLLKNELEINLLTADRDFGDNEAYSQVDINKWTSIDDIKIIYLSPKKNNILTYYNILKSNNYDVIYLNSFFNFRFTFIPLITAKYFLKKK
jgi:hypothetical protein